MGDDDIKVTTAASEATYIREGNVLKGIDFVRLARVKTADEIKEMRLAQGVDSALDYYVQCMEDMAKQAAWYCGGCQTGQMLWGIGCAAFNPCLWGSNVTCIGLAILDRFR